MHAPVSEIYGSSGYDSSDDSGPPDRDSPSFGSSWGDSWQPEYSVYDHDASGDYGTGDDQAGDLRGDQDPDAENYADIDAILARDNKLPEPRTRQEVAEEADRADPDTSDYDQATDADIEVISHESDHIPELRTRQQAAREDAVLDQAPTLTETGTEADDHQRDEDPYPVAEHGDPGEHAGRTDVGAGTADWAGATDDIWRQRVADLEAANAELKHENTQLGRGMAELESENAELGKNFAALEGRLERLEQSSLDRPSMSIRDRDQGVLGSADQEVKQERDRKAPSSEALLFGAAAIGGVVTTIADYAQYVPANIAGITASMLAAGAAAVAWMRKRKEG
jgi:hypothetical protein